MNLVTKMILTGLIAAPAVSAWADAPVMSAMQTPEVYKQECASCHMAYAPEFLSKSAWRRVMDSLDKHYGTDASLDPETSRSISNWVSQYAGRYKRVVESSKEDRLTTTPWFARKHNDINPGVFQRATIKSPANCAACHTQAERGNYDDDNVRIPK